MTTEHNIDSSQINQNIERTVDRTALRKVRSLVDEQEQAHAKQRRVHIIAASAFAVLLAAWATSHFMSAGERARQASEAAERACLLDAWGANAVSLETDLKLRHPTLSRKEVQALMRALHAESDAANAATCAKAGKP